MKKYKLIIEKNKDGFWGRIDKLKGVYSFGESIEELQSNIHEAIELYFEDKGTRKPNCDFELVMDIREFFIVNDFINITTLAKKIGMNPSLLRQYSRGIKYPSLKQVNKIEKTIKELGEQLVKTQLQAH